MERVAVPILSLYRPLPYVRILVWFRGGSSLEGEEELGWAHLLEHLLFKVRYEGETIAEFVERQGGQSNAFTSHDAVVIEATVRLEDTVPTLRFLSEVLSTPLTTIGMLDFEEERAVVLEELRLYDDEPYERLSNAVMRNCYPGHPYGREVIGKERSLRAATLHRLEHFFRTRLSHGSFVVVVGGFDGHATFSLPQCLPPSLPRIATWRSKKQLTLRHGQCKNYFLAAWRMPESDPRSLAAARLIYTITSDMEGSRFRNNLVYDTNTFDSLSMNVINGLRGLSFVLGTVSDPSRVGMRLRRLMAEWRRFDVTTEDVVRAREVILSDECFSSEGVGTIAEVMGISYLSSGDPYRLEREVFWHIAHLTARDINDFFQRNLAFGKAVVGLATPSPHTALSLPVLGPDFSAQKREKNQILTIRKRGVHIMVRHADEKPFVVLYALKKSGVLADPPKRGGALRLMLETLTARGKGMSREETDQFLDRFGMSVEPVFGNNTGGLRLIVRDAFLPEAIEILGKILANPLHREDFIREKEHTLARLSLKGESPAALIKEKIHELLFAGTPYDHPPEGTLSSVSATTFRDVMAVYRDFFTRGRWSLGIAGSASRRFAEEVARLFPQKDETPYSTPCRSRAVLDDRVVRIVIPGRRQRHIVRLFRIPGVRDTARFEILRFIEQSLVGQKSPLFQRLREEEGLVYSLDVWSAVGLTEGYVGLYAVTSPEKCLRVMHRIGETVASFCSGEISSSYFDEVKNAILFEHARSVVRNEFHAFNLALEDAVGLPLGTYLRQPSAVEALTKGDIVSYACTYFGKGLWIVSEG